MGHRIGFAGNDDFIAGGGLLSNVDVEFRDCRWSSWDYNGKFADKPMLAFIAQLHPIVDGVVDEESFEQTVWTAGNLAGVIPVEDGRYLEAEQEGFKLKDSTNYNTFRQSHVQHGFELTDSDAHQYNGLQAHVIRVVTASRDGLPDTNEKGNKKQVVLISHIVKKPGESGKKGAKGKAGAAAPTATKATAGATASAKGKAGAGDIDSIAQKFVSDNAPDADTTVTDFVRIIFKLMKEAETPTAERNGVLVKIKDTAWLSEALGTTYDVDAEGAITFLG